MEYLRPQSRPAEPPYLVIDQQATAASMVAERTLMRSLLLRCESVLQDFVIEERASGHKDEQVERLLQDISVALRN
jgi:hypothetical protein